MSSYILHTESSWIVVHRDECQYAKSDDPIYATMKEAARCVKESKKRPWPCAVCNGEVRTLAGFCEWVVRFTLSAYEH